MAQAESRVRIQEVDVETDLVREWCFLLCYEEDLIVACLIVESQRHPDEIGSTTLVTDVIVEAEGQRLCA